MHSLTEALRDLLRARSVASGQVDALFKAADANADGFVDMLELMRALYKWGQSASARVDRSLATARDGAMDMFLLLRENPIRRAQYCCLHCQHSVSAPQIFCT